MSERELNYSPNYDEYNAFIQRFSNSLVILITSRVGENDEGLSDAKEALFSYWGQCYSSVEISVKSYFPCDAILESYKRTFGIDIAKYIYPPLTLLNDQLNVLPVCEIDLEHYYREIVDASRQQMLVYAGENRDEDADVVHDDEEGHQNEGYHGVEVNIYQEDNDEDTDEENACEQYDEVNDYVGSDFNEDDVRSSEDELEVPYQAQSYPLLSEIVESEDSLDGHVANDEVIEIDDDRETNEVIEIDEEKEANEVIEIDDEGEVIEVIEIYDEREVVEVIEIYDEREVDEVIEIDDERDDNEVIEIEDDSGVEMESDESDYDSNEESSEEENEVIYIR